MNASSKTLVAVFALAISSVACARQPVTPAALTPGGADVEFAMSTPSDGMASFVGNVEVSDEGAGVDDATEAARTKLRNEAARMGATLVTVDADRGEKVFLNESVKVTLTGRAFRSVD